MEGSFLEFFFFFFLLRSLWPDKPMVDILLLEKVIFILINVSMNFLGEG